MDRTSSLLVVLCLLVLTPNGISCVNAQGQRPGPSAGLRCPRAIFGFGDSFTDTGEALLQFPSPSVVLAGNEPYGQTFPGFPTGRFSDGRVIIDYIAGALGFPSGGPFGFPMGSPFFDSLSPNFKHGVNFAAAGSTARRTSAQIPLHLSIQVDQALFFYKNAVQVSGPRRPTTPVPDATAFWDDGLYIIQTGGNDILLSLFGGASLDAIRQSIAPEAVSNISAAIDTLYKQIGARQFLVFNVPPVGCTPFGLTLFGQLPGAGPVGADGCLTGINQLVQDFNALTKTAVEEARKRLPGTAVVYVDFYQAYLDLVTNFKSYGFLEAFKACCGSGTGPFNFDIQAQCGSPGVKACPNPSRYVSWDGVHLTDAAAKIVAQWVVEGKILDPPLNAKAICNLH